MTPFNWKSACLLLEKEEEDESSIGFDSRGGRVPQKMENLGDIVYGWSFS